MSHAGLMIARWKLQPGLLSSKAISAVMGKLSFSASKPRNQPIQCWGFFVWWLFFLRYCKIMTVFRKPRTLQLLNTGSAALLWIIWNDFIFCRVVLDLPTWDLWRLVCLAAVERCGGRTTVQASPSCCGRRRAGCSPCEVVPGLMIVKGD